MTTLTPKQRVGAFLAGQPVDRPLCVPLILNHAARVLNVTIKRYATSGDVMGRAHVAAYRRYGQDLITIFSDTAILAEAMGSRLYFPNDDVPRLQTPVIATPDDVVRLETVDANRAGRLPVYLDAIRQCVADAGEEVFISCCYAAPFTTAAGLRGTANFARDLYKNPNLAHVLLEKSLKLVEDFAVAVAAAGGIPVLVDPIASGSVISRKAFEEFALPPLVKALAKIRSLGLPPILHICGKTAAIADLMAQSGAAVLSIDQITVREAREKVKDSVCIMGNVAPTQTLLEGTPDSIRAAARQCLEEAKGCPRGFILASGCEVPIATPPENLLALMNAVRGA